MRMDPKSIELSRITLRRITVSRMTFSKMTLSGLTLFRMTLSRKQSICYQVFFLVLQLMHSSARCHYENSHFPDCPTNITPVCVILLSVIQKNTITINRMVPKGILLSVIVPNVILIANLLNVILPNGTLLNVIF